MPVRVWAKYGFVHSSNGANIPGNTVARNLAGLGLSASWPPREGLPEASGRRYD